MRRTAWLTLLSDWLPKLASLLAVVVMARRLGAGDFAHFAVALGWVGYAWWAVDLGQAGYSIRTLAASRGAEQHRLGCEVWSLYVLVAACVSAVLVLGLLVTGAAGSTQGRLLLVMTPFLLSYAVFPDWWLRARGLLLPLGAANWATALVLLLVASLSPPAGGVTFAAATGLAPLAGAVVALLTLHRSGGLPRWVGSASAWRRHLRTSLLFSAAGAGGQVAVPLALAVMATGGDLAATGAFALGLRVAGAAAGALWQLLHNGLPLLMARGQHVTLVALAGSALVPLAGLGAGALAWGPLLLPVVGLSYVGHGAAAALGAALLVVWGPKYLVEIELITRYADRRRVAMNLVTPVVVVTAVLVGAGSWSVWAVPSALLLGETAATALGLLLLRPRRAVPPSVNVPAGAPTTAARR